MLAYAMRNGVIGFADDIADVPNGAGVFAGTFGEASEFQLTVEARARLAKDGAYFLVPGVPEAQSDSEAIDAFYGWVAWAFPGEIIAFTGTV